jgi:hypothetical protein
MSDEPQIILAKNGKAFPTEEAARTASVDQKLTEAWQPVPVGEGFALVRMVMRPPTSGEPQPGPAPASRYRYFRVIFQERTDDRQSVDVWLNNISAGQALKFQRGVEVIVPEPYLQLAQDAHYYKYVAVAGQAYKQGRKVREYMWQIEGTKLPDGSTATEAEFNTALRSGNRIQNAYLEGRGLGSDQQVKDGQEAAVAAAPM